MNTQTIRLHFLRWALYSLLLAYQANALALPPLPGNVEALDLPERVAGERLLRSAEEIRDWTSHENRAAMQDHAWRLFAAIMKARYQAPDGQVYRLYDTWYSLDEAVPPIGTSLLTNKTSRRLQRRLELPAQLAHFGFHQRILGGQNQPEPSSGDRTLGETAVSDVKYSPALVSWIRNTLTDTGPDGKVNAYRLSSQIQSEQINHLTFTDPRGVMLKPAYTIVKGKGPTVIARWAEAIETVNPRSVEQFKEPIFANPSVSAERTWSREAVIVPSSWSSRQKAMLNLHGRDGSRLPVFSVADFHHFKITSAMADALKTGILKELMGPNVTQIEAGDYAVLTSMHIATRESDDWTWQTFWWQPLRNNLSHKERAQKLASRGLSEAVLAHIERTPELAILKHFNLGVGYSNTTPDGKDVICSNPYLEGAFAMPEALNGVFGKTQTDGVNVFLRDAQDNALKPYVKEGRGLKTNCMTCHRAAAYPPPEDNGLVKGKYPDYGELSASDPIFKGRLTTHYLWGLSNKVKAREESAQRP